MEEPRAIAKQLPLTEATFYILLALLEQKHGYAIMQDAEEMSEGTVKLGPGTLYGALTTLEASRYIRMVGQEQRRKIYVITDLGKQILKAQMRRYGIMLGSAKKKWNSTDDVEPLEV